MPDQLTSAGLSVATLNELIASLGTSLQSIYGSDINLDSNSPDGQLVNIFAQAGIDLRELLVSVYNSFSVEESFGVYLDQRVALNGLARRQGTHTMTLVTVVVSTTVNLIGLDALSLNPNAIVFTVQDANAVKYQLISSVSIGAGSHVLSFQAADIGVVQPSLNTITVQTTIVAGVTSVNNPSAATSLGTPEESDADLKIRHAKMFKLASTGPSDSIEAALRAIPDVVDAFVPENDTASPAGGIAAHSIWAIVNGGTDAEVGQAIYAKKAPGCGMVGGTSYVVTRPNGTSFTAKFDRALTETLYIQFTITPKTSGIVFDDASIKAAIVAGLTYKLNQVATIGDVIVFMNANYPQAILSAVGVSATGSGYTDTLAPTDYQHYFVLDASRISIS